MWYGSYQGYYNENFLRSSFEYIYAVCIEKMGYNYKVEERCFNLNNGHTYRPDFFLYDDNGILIKIVEIKSTNIDRLIEAKAKIKLVEKIYGITIELYSKPELKRLCLENGFKFNDLVDKWKILSKGCHISTGESHFAYGEKSSSAKYEPFLSFNYTSGEFLKYYKYQFESKRDGFQHAREIIDNTMWQENNTYFRKATNEEILFCENSIESNNTKLTCIQNEDMSEIHRVITEHMSISQIGVQADENHWKAEYKPIISIDFKTGAFIKFYRYKFEIKHEGYNFGDVDKILKNKTLNHTKGTHFRYATFEETEFCEGILKKGEDIKSHWTKIEDFTELRKQIHENRSNVNKGRSGEKSPTGKKVIVFNKEDNSIYNIFVTAKEASDKMNIIYSTLSHYLKNPQPKRLKYIFMYYDEYIERKAINTTIIQNTISI